MTRLRSFLLSTLTFALSPLASMAQLSDQAQSHLESMAEDTLKQSNSLQELASAAQVLSYLDKVEYSGKTCSRIAKLVQESNDDLTLPSQVMFKAQINKLLSCDAPVFSNAKKEIEQIINLKSSFVKDLPQSELYYAFLLNQSARSFGVTGDTLGDQLVNFLSQKAMNDWLPNFNADKWTMKQIFRETDSQGDIKERVQTQNLDSDLLQITEMIASLISQKDVSKDASKKLEQALKKLVAEAMPESGRFFTSKSLQKASSQGDLTFHAYQTIREYNNQVKQADKKIDNVSSNEALRDYFVTKAVGSKDANMAAMALKAVNQITQYNALPFLKVTKGDKQVVGKDGTVTVKFLNALGQDTNLSQYELKSVKFLYSDQEEAQDTTDVMKAFDESEGQLMMTLPKNQRKGTFKVRAELEEKKKSKNVITLVTKELVHVATKMAINDFAFELSEKANQSGRNNNQQQTKFPSKVASLDQKQGTDNSFMHFSASVDLVDSKDKVLGHPQQVYLAFKKTDTRQDEQLQVNAQAKWNESAGKFEGKVDFSGQFDLVNGKYEVTLLAQDVSATSQASWSLGSITVWFKEGQNDANNQRMNASYFPERKIVAQFPPTNEKEKNPIFSMVFTGAIVSVFIWHISQQFGQNANIKRLDFWGTLMLAELLLILGVITCFWIQVKLTDTLWILFWLCPVHLYLFNKGLAGSAQCELQTSK